MDKDKERNKNKRLKAGDVALWKEMTKDVARFEGRDYQEGGDDEKASESAAPPSLRPRAPVPPPKASPVQALSTPQGREMDKRSEERLRKGQMGIDGRLDLHGMNQGDARQALRGFLLDGYGRGLRCVLVITGKGRTGKTSDEMDDRKPGVLKRNVPMWLREEGLGDIVLKAAPAKAQHGGDGALYVLLRRKR